MQRILGSRRISLRLIIMSIQHLNSRLLSNSAPGSDCDSSLAVRARPLAVPLLLLVQAILLAYSATRHSPVHLEPPFLAAGLSHWELNRYELFRVNPPLVRMIAALPVIGNGYESNWSNFDPISRLRPEYSVGRDFIRANGPRTQQLIVSARWACIPFSLTGAYFAYRWATELYGRNAGLLTLSCFILEPNLLALGEFLTPDAACNAFSILAGYTFWHWLKSQTWWNAGLAGISLGLAISAKFTALILVALWPLLWLMWVTIEAWGRRNQRSGTDVPSHPHSLNPLNWTGAVQLPAIIAIAVVVLNSTYSFDGISTPLSDLEFKSKALSALHARLEESGLPAWLPLPVSPQVLLGLDAVQTDFEFHRRPSFFRGEWRVGGWMTYYLHGLSVKTPIGILIALGIILMSRAIWKHGSMDLIRNEAVLFVPALALMAIASCQTAFNHHFRYVLPCIGILTIFLGQLATLESISARSRWVLSTCLVATMAISLGSVYPHHLSYFNSLAGGTRNGHEHLMGSCFDWGQDLLLIKDATVEGRKIDMVYTDYASCVMLNALGVESRQQPSSSSEIGFPSDSAPDAKLIAVSVAHLKESEFLQSPEANPVAASVEPMKCWLSAVRKLSPVSTIGAGTYHVYRVHSDHKSVATSATQ